VSTSTGAPDPVSLNSRTRSVAVGQAEVDDRHVYAVEPAGVPADLGERAGLGPRLEDRLRLEYGREDLTEGGMIPDEIHAVHVSPSRPCRLVASRGLGSRYASCALDAREERPLCRASHPAFVLAGREGED